MSHFVFAVESFQAKLALAEFIGLLSSAFGRVSAIAHGQSYGRLGAGQASHDVKARLQLNVEVVGK